MRIGIGEFLEDIVKVGAQNGWGPLYPDHRWMLVGANKVAHLLWIYVYTRYGKYVLAMHEFLILCNVSDSWP